jgi:predicted nucleotidyltransferase
MIRERIVDDLRNLARGLGPKVKGTQWHLFGSVDRDDVNAADIDLMILCESHDQADALRRTIDADAFTLPLHLALLTFEEAAEVGAIRVQRSQAIFP